jgi:hypothetical protein
MLSGQKSWRWRVATGVFKIAVGRRISFNELVASLSEITGHNPVKNQKHGVEKLYKKHTPDLLSI